MMTTITQIHSLASPLAVSVSGSDILVKGMSIKIQGIKLKTLEAFMALGMATGVEHVLIRSAPSTILDSNTSHHKPMFMTPDTL